MDSIKEGKPYTDASGKIIIKGIVQNLREGDTYSLTAEYVEDPKWGGQYKIISMFKAVDFDETNERGQVKFLESLFTPLQVQNMYKALKNPFDTLKNTRVDELVKVKGCGQQTAQRWITRFNNNLYLSCIFSELSDYNLTNSIVERLIEVYKTPEIVIEKVKNNPYVLCSEVEGIGWKTADKIALESGIDPQGKERTAAFMYHYMNNAGAEGYSWVETEVLLKEIHNTLGAVTNPTINEAWQSLGDKIWLSKCKRRIGLQKYYNIEEKIAKELFRIMNAKSNITYGDWESQLKSIEKSNGWEFSDEQKYGVKTVLENNVTIVYGQAGTGKSTSVSAFLQVLKDYFFVQCALSGRAGARMTEITGKEGYTIHRLLGYPCHMECGKNGFAYHDENPLETDIVIVDELSMVDAFLFYYLLRAIPSGAKLVCLGDIGQLEAIGCGNVMFDMINSGAIPTVHLTQIHRQAAKSAIITDSRKIRKGEQIVTPNYTGREVRGELQDLVLDCYTNKSETFDKIVGEFEEAMQNEDFNIAETQVLVPIKNNGRACAYNLNNVIQDIYNPPKSNKPEVEIHSDGKTIILRKGDKVINTQNMYSTEPPVFNGNIGIIKEVYPKEREIVVDFAAIGEIHLGSSQISGINLGYAITIHKSQGSQFDNVILGIDMSSYSLLTRELLYTGITRAKKKCFLIAQTSALQLATNKESISKKQTHLCECLKNCFNSFNS